MLHQHGAPFSRVFHGILQIQAFAHVCSLPGASLPWLTSDILSPTAKLLTQALF